MIRPESVRPVSIKGRVSAFTLTAFALLTACAPIAGAQMQPPPEQPPVITVGGTGEVEVAPDRARVMVGVQTDAATAAQAADENNRKQAAVLKAIQALGIPSSQIKTLNYNVAPITRYDDKLKRTVVDGYRVSNIVSVETDKLNQTGAIIDAGLSNGANQVAGLNFYLKDQTKARDAALTKAVESAKRNAELAASAAGGRLGDLIELSISNYYLPDNNDFAGRGVARGMEMAAMAAPAPISEGTTKISISVSTRWKYEKR